MLDITQNATKLAFVPLTADSETIALRNMHFKIQSFIMALAENRETIKSGIKREEFLPDYDFCSGFLGLIATHYINQI